MRNSGAPLGPEAPRRADGHVGIDNVERRLAGHYGPNATLTLTAEPAGTTLAELVLPLVDEARSFEDEHDVEVVAGRPGRR